MPIQVRHRRVAIIEQTLDNPDEREALAENVGNFNLEVQNDEQHPQSLRRSTRESIRSRPAGPDQRGDRPIN